MGDYRPAFLVLGILFPILATIFVVLRLESKRLRTGKALKLTADDWCIILALIFCYGWSVNIIIDSRLGNLGGHMQFSPEGLPIPGPSTEVFLKTNYVSTVLTVPAIGFTKISLLLLYQRIFASHQFRRTTWIVLVLMAAWLISFLFAMLFSCWPLFAQWEQTTNGGCVDLWALYMAGVCSNTATDILILTWPIYQVWKLQLPTSRKIAVMGMFLIGGFVTIVGIIRIYYLAKAKDALTDPFWNDITYNYSPAILWTIVELNVGVICACLPLLRPVYEGYKLNSVVGSMKSLLSLSRSTHSGSKVYKTGSEGSVEPNSSDHIRLPSSEGQGYQHELKAIGRSDYDSRTYTIGGKGQYTNDSGSIIVQKTFQRSENIV